MRRPKAVEPAPPIVEEVAPVLHDPAPHNDPAADVISWLRREFDDVHNQMRAISERLARQEALIVRTAGGQSAELNVSLAELEGCAAQLRNEAAGLGDVRTALAEALPRLVVEALGPAVAPAVTAALAGSAGEARAAVTDMGAALAQALPAAVAEAVRPAVAEAVAPAVAEALAADPPRAVASGPPAPSAAAHLATPEAAEVADPVSQLHLAQDEAAEWLVILVEEAVRRAVGEQLAAIAPAPLAADGRSPDDNGSPVQAPATAVAADPPPIASPMVAGAAVSDVGHQQAGLRGPDPTPGPAPVSPVTCSLADAAVGPTLAVGVSAALRRARLLRRRRRQAGPPSAGLFRHDPFAGDLSRELDRFALARGGLACDVPGAAVPVAVGDLHGQEVAVDLATHPLAVVGEQAGDAARALVLTALAGRSAQPVRVLVAGEVLPPGATWPGLDRVSTLDAALTEIESELDRRQQRPGDGYGPTIVLAASGLGPSDADRVDDVLRRGRSLGITAVAAGTGLEQATTLTLLPGALVSAPTDAPAALDGSRAYTLGPEAAVEVAGVLAEALADDGLAPPVEPDEEPFPVLSPQGPASVDVQLLGPYRIQVGGAEIKSGLRAKARELLAFYLLHPEGTTLDAATEALWPEADPGRGSEWFWTALGNLRSLLRNAVGVKELKVIERDGDRYKVEPIFDVDLWRFQRALPAAIASISTSDPQWATALSTAAQLYEGELLADVDWAWAEVPREDLRRRAVDVLVALAATRLVAGETAAAIDALSRAVEVDPLAEQAYRRMMRAYAKLGHTDEVAATLRRLEARLAELGLDPTPESVKLAAELAKEPSPLAGTLPVAGR